MTKIARCCLLAVLAAVGCSASAQAVTNSVYFTNNFATSPYSTSVSQYSVPVGGSLTAKSPATATAGQNPGAIVVAPTATSAYVANGGGTGISQLTLAADGTLTPMSPASAPSNGFPYGAAISPDGSVLYVTDYNTSDVAIYQVGSDGKLGTRTTTATGANPSQVALTPDGKNLYVTDGNVVSQYTVGSAGSLTAKSTATVASGTTPDDIEISPDGSSAYVVAKGSNAIYEFDIGSDGALTAKSTASIATGASTSPYKLAIAPDGKSLYVTYFGAAQVGQFSIGAGGQLTAKATATISLAAGSEPDGIAITAGGGNLYAGEDGNDLIAEFNVSSTSGQLTANSTPTIATSVVTGGAVKGFATFGAVTPDFGPTASFTAASSVQTGTPVAFSGAGSTDLDGSVRNYTWDFGDGATDSRPSSATTHTYSAPGTYTARLTVRDDDGCSTAFIYTGQQDLCEGGPAASTTRTIVVTAPQQSSTGPVVASASAPGAKYSKGKLKITYALSAPSKVAFAVTAKKGKKTTTKAKAGQNGKPGKNTFTLKKKLKKGSYKLAITPAGGKAITKSFKAKK